jgi:hypothetical protein
MAAPLNGISYFAKLSAGQISYRSWAKKALYKLTAPQVYVL